MIYRRSLTKTPSACFNHLAFIYFPSQRVSRDWSHQQLHLFSTQRVFVYSRSFSLLVFLWLSHVGVCRKYLRRFLSFNCKNSRKAPPFSCTDIHFTKYNKWPGFVFIARMRPHIFFPGTVLWVGFHTKIFTSWWNDCRLTVITIFWNYFVSRTSTWPIKRRLHIPSILNHEPHV